MGEKLDLLIALMETEFGGISFNGPNLVKTLEKMTLDQVKTKETYEGFTVYGAVLHMLFFHQKVGKFIDSEWKYNFPYEAPKDFNYFPDPPENLSDTEWKKAVDELKGVHSHLMEILKKFPDSRLDDPIEEWKTTFRPVLIWLGTHYSYHTSMIRNMGIKGLDFHPPTPD